MQPFLLNLSSSATLKWGSFLLNDYPCVKRGCPESAVGYCAGCGRTVCLAHAAVSMRGDVVCLKCVTDLHGDGPSPKNASSKRRKQRATSGDTDVDACLRVLGITPSDDWDERWEEIKARYRELARLKHPDRGGDTEAFARINDAFETLRPLAEDP